MSEASAATSTAKVVDGYFAIWNQTDPDRRRELIATTWTDDASYVDPLFEASGPAALDEMVATVHQRYPDHRFRLTAPVEAHHERPLGLGARRPGRAADRRRRRLRRAGRGRATAGGHRLLRAEPARPRHPGRRLDQAPQLRRDRPLPAEPGPSAAPRRGARPAAARAQPPAAGRRLRPGLLRGELESEELAVVRDAVRQVLSGHEPYPAAVVDRALPLAGSGNGT
jgi:hypothetical protein